MEMRDINNKHNFKDDIIEWERKFQIQMLDTFISKII